MVEGDTWAHTTMAGGTVCVGRPARRADLRRGRGANRADGAAPSRRLHSVPATRRTARSTEIEPQRYRCRRRRRASSKRAWAGVARPSTGAPEPSVERSATPSLTTIGRSGARSGVAPSACGFAAATFTRPPFDLLTIVLLSIGLCWMSTSTAASRWLCTTRSRPRSAAPSRRARRVRVSACRWPRTWPRCSGSTRTRCCGLSTSCGTRVSSNSRAVGASPCRERRRRVQSWAACREVVEFARRQGYRREDVIDMISGLP